MDDTPFALTPPPKPRSTFMHAVMGAISWAITGAGLGALFALCRGRNGGRMAAEVVDSAVNLGVVGGIVGLTEGSAAQREHTLRTENVALKNTLNAFERKMSHVEHALTHQDTPLQK